MASLTIRNLPDEVHRALKARARRHGRSAEAEVRDILRRATGPSANAGFGDELAALGAALGGVEVPLKRSGKPMRKAALT